MEPKLDLKLLMVMPNSFISFVVAKYAGRALKAWFRTVVAPHNIDAPYDTKFLNQMLVLVLKSIAKSELIRLLIDCDATICSCLIHVILFHNNIHVEHLRYNFIVCHISM